MRGDPDERRHAHASGAIMRRAGWTTIGHTSAGRITIHQGEDLGRPSELVVDIGAAPGIRVTGNAVAIS